MGGCAAGLLGVPVDCGIVVVASNCLTYPLSHGISFLQLGRRLTQNPCARVGR